MQALPLCSSGCRFSLLTLCLQSDSSIVLHLGKQLCLNRMGESRPFVVPGCTLKAMVTLQSTSSLPRPMRTSENQRPAKCRSQRTKSWRGRSTRPLWRKLSRGLSWFVRVISVLVGKSSVCAGNFPAGCGHPAVCRHLALFTAQLFRKIAVGGRGGE